MRRLLPILIPLALVGCSQNEPAAEGKATSPGPAAEVPLAGLWTTTTMVNGKKAFGENRTCQGAEALTADAPGGEDTAGCTTASRETRADGYSYELVCEKDGLRSVVTGEVRHQAKRTSSTSTTRIYGPGGKEAAPAATVQVDSVYSGPCPAGMKPGDFVQQGVG